MTGELFILIQINLKSHKRRNLVIHEFSYRLLVVTVNVNTHFKLFEMMGAMW